MCYLELEDSTVKSRSSALYTSPSNITRGHRPLVLTTIPTAPCGILTDFPPIRVQTTT